ncbi:Phytochrome-like protein cph2 [compost metagenome]
MPPGVGTVTVSVGVALWPQDAALPQAVVKGADLALYASKQNGRNRVTRWNKQALSTMSEGKVAT